MEPRKNILQRASSILGIPTEVDNNEAMLQQAANSCRELLLKKLEASPPSEQEKIEIENLLLCLCQYWPINKDKIPEEYHGILRSYPSSRHYRQVKEEDLIRLREENSWLPSPIPTTSGYLIYNPRDIDAQDLQQLPLKEREKVTNLIQLATEVIKTRSAKNRTSLAAFFANPFKSPPTTMVTAGIYILGGGLIGSIAAMAAATLGVGLIAAGITITVMAAIQFADILYTNRQANKASEKHQAALQKYETAYEENFVPIVNYQKNLQGKVTTQTITQPAPGVSMRPAASSSASVATHGMLFDNKSEKNPSGTANSLATSSRQPKK